MRWVRANSDDCGCSLDAKMLARAVYRSTAAKTPGCTLLVRRANQDQAAALDQVTRWELGRRVAETIRGLNAQCADTGATTAFWLSASDSLRIERHSLAASAVPRCSPTRFNSHKAESRK